MAHPRRPSLGSGHWAAYMATGNPVVLTSATLPELVDALRLAREDVTMLKREVSMLNAEQVALALEARPPTDDLEPF